MTRALVCRLLALLDASPLPAHDPLRLQLEWELIALRTLAERRARVAESERRQRQRQTARRRQRRRERASLVA